MLQNRDVIETKEKMGVRKDIFDYTCSAPNSSPSPPKARPFPSPLAYCFSRPHELSRFPLSFFTGSRVSSLYYFFYISVALLIFLRPLVSRNDYSFVRFWKTSSSFCNHVCMPKQHVSTLTPPVPGLRV